MEHIRFYCGITHKYWNGHLCDPGSYACVSPIIGCGRGQFTVNGVYVPVGTLVLQDSGAYGDSLVSQSSCRLSFEEAFRRQEEHAERYEYGDKIDYRASYDLLVDHRFSEGKTRSTGRKIIRCSESAGIEAVEVTVDAAKYLDRHRNGYKLALNVQGVTPVQYLTCVQQVVPFLREGDILGMGGWCILGRLPSMMGTFLETLALVIPFLSSNGILSVHLYGCIYTPGIAAILAICDAYGIKLSVDSAFPSFGPRVGKWGYGSWRREHYTRPSVLSGCRAQICPPGTCCLGLECIRHILLTREWLAKFPEREEYLYRKYALNIDQYCLGQILDLDLYN